MANSKIKFTKFGLAEDPRGLNVCMDYQGRHLLGTVKSVRRDDMHGCYYLAVYHFCGDKWPIEPRALAVDII